MVYFIKRYSKYHAKSSIYKDSIYHSQKEAGYAAELDLRIKAGEIKSWRRQVRISLDVYGEHICNYYIDFELTYPDESIEMVEVKGFETEVWRLKWKLFEAIYGKEHPEIILTVVK